MNKTSESNLFQAKAWQLRCYSSTRGVISLFTVLLTFVSYIAAGGYGVAVAIAGTIATGTRLLDGITDPIMALIGDRIITRYGRVRILLGLGFLIMFLSLGTIFFWGIGTNVIVYTIAYCCFVIGNTLYTIGSETGYVILTKEPKQRAKIGQYGLFYTTISSVILSVYNANILMPKYKGLTIEALQELCILVLIGTAVMTVLAICGISEKDTPDNLSIGAERIKLKDCFRLLKENVPLRCFIVSMASDQVAQQIASQSAISIMIFGIIIGNYSFRGSLSLIELVPTLLVVFFATRLAGKRGIKDALVRWSKVCMLISVLMVAYLAVVDPKQISVAFLPTAGFLILDVLYVASRSAVSAFTNAIRPDIADYELYRSGMFMPGMIGATVTFCNKMISSLSTTIVGFCLAGIGYVTTMPQPQDAMTSTIFVMAVFLWMGMPFLGWLCTVIAMKFYKLDSEKMIEIQKVNAERRMNAK